MTCGARNPMPEPGFRITTTLRAVPAVLLVVLLTTAAVASAHVALDTPNGGESLKVGSMYAITWHDTISHGPANFDLWYSTTGANGPWIDIVSDLTDYSYQWQVPDAASDQVRVRVRQDNAGADYDDISDADLAIIKTGTAATETETLAAAGDAAIYEGDGSLANGAGSYLFVGRTDTQNSQLERRSLLAFDIAGTIPAGATITAVSLELQMSRTISGTHTVELRRVLESWSEGPSDPAGQEGGGAAAAAGDVTWVHREYPGSSWSTPGGSFSATASATQQILGIGGYTFSGSGMVADVQSWLDDASGNHGWALVMPSAPAASAKRFNSRENSDGTAPRLSVSYTASTELPVADFSFSPASPHAGDTVSFSDLSTGSPASWSWSFGDGTSTDEQSPSHSYGATGTYSVSLTVSNANGSDSTSKLLTVMPDVEPQLSELIIVPAAANAAGSGGSFFVTTVDVHNAGTATAAYRFVWLPRESDNSDAQQSSLLMLAPGTVQRFDNLLAEVFGITGAGAAAVLSDSTQLQVMSRTFNQTDNGTFGQSLPGVAAPELIQAGTRARILFLSSNDDYRSNLGLINGTGSPITVHWELFASDGGSLGSDETVLPAWGNLQRNRVLSRYAPIEAAYADVWTTTSGGALTCYGSVLDEVSSDGTTVLPR